MLKNPKMKSDITLKSGIYKITNTTNDKKYIGKDSNLPKRWSTHIGLLREGAHGNSHLQASYKKYGEDAFVYEILEYCEKKDLKTREQHYMDLLDTLNPTKGYNKKDADDNIISEETRIKMSEAQIGKKHT